MCPGQRLLPGPLATVFVAHCLLASENNDPCNPVFEFPNIARPFALLEDPKNI